MTNPRVIILVLAAEGVYTSLIKAIRETWGQSKEHEILYYYGYNSFSPRPKPHEAIQVGDCVVVGCEETLGNITLKTMQTFELLLKNHQFDYIFRCCCGSYIVPSELTRFIAPQPRTSFYCGIRGQHHSVSFASGSGYFLSRDLVQLVVTKKAQILTSGEPDDVALGAFMMRHSIPIHPSARRTDLDSPALTPGAYHYHFRHRPDLMYAIHKLYQ